MIRRKTLVTALAALALASTAAAAPVLFENFESYSADVAGPGYQEYIGGTLGPWAITGRVDVVNNPDWSASWPANDSQSLDLNGSATGGISRTIALTDPGQYWVTFNYAANGGGDKSFTVTVTDAALNVLATGVYNNPTNTLLPAALPFNVAAGGNVTLSFNSNVGGSAGGVVDNITVDVPEPSDLLLLGAGLSLVGLLARRRRTRA